MSGMLDPTARQGARAGTLAPRAGSLEGATIGLLNNSKRNSDLLLEAIGQELKTHCGVAEVIELGKPSASYVVSPGLDRRSADRAGHGRAPGAIPGNDASHR